MQTQLIILDGVFFCTVFSVDEDTRTILIRGTKSADDQRRIREWLEQQDYPLSDLLLREREPGVLPPAFYIRPHTNDLYYRVDPDSHTRTQEDAANFREPLVLEQI